MKSSGENKDTETSQKFNIESYNIELKDKKAPEFTVDVAISSVKSEHLDLYLNETFKVSEVISDKKSLSFNQKKNKVGIELNGQEDQVITFVYQTDHGTALNPVNTSYLFLPYFFNWLPSSDSTQDYYVWNKHTVDFNKQSNTCNGVKKFKSDVKGLIVETSSDRTCLSVIKGDFTKQEVGPQTAVIPKAWVGNVGEVRDYNQVLEEGMNLFNDTFDSRHSINKGNLILIPKYDANSQDKFSDFWIQDNYQIMLMDPFLNVREDKVFLTLADKVIFNLAYSTLRDVNTDANRQDIETFSSLFAIYFIKESSFEINDYAYSYFLSVSDSHAIEEFLKLDSKQMKEQLVSRLSAIYEGGAR